MMQTHTKPTSRMEDNANAQWADEPRLGSARHALQIIHKMTLQNKLKSSVSTQLLVRPEKHGGSSNATAVLLSPPAVPS